MDRTTSNSLAANPQRKSWWKTGLGVGSSLLLIGIVTPWVVGPACPKKVVIATGSDMGAYYAFGQKYGELLEREGIELEVRKTAGSVENAELLKDADSGVSAAIIQGGTAKKGDASDLNDSGIQSLASLFLEPIWVFYRKEAAITRLADLRGKRVIVGPQGSGTRAVALELLADNNLVSQNGASNGRITCLGLGGREAIEALKAGRADAAFFALAPTAPLIRELIRDETIELLHFDRTLAYKRRHPYLTSVTISEGMLDLERNLPNRDIELLAPTAVLVARDDLHPALVPLFLKAASAVHEGGGVLEVPREFPSEEHVEYPLDPDARSYLRSGPSFLYRTFPFAVAAWMDRMKLMLLPLCTLLIPLIKAAPPLYRWRTRSKIYTWYRVLREVDQARREAGDGNGSAQFIERLQQVERELSEISVPLSFMEEFYNLRWHVAFVLEQLEKVQQQRVAPDSLAAQEASQRDIRQIPNLGSQISKAA